MCYPRGMIDNSDFAKDFLAEYNDPKSNKKSLGQAIGLPDKEDEEFILGLVKKYEAQNPGWLTYMRNEARRQFEAGQYGNLRNEGAIVNKESTMTYDFELPPSFYKLIEGHYPLMFKNIDHYRWFKKTFSALMVRPNTKRRLKKP